MKYLSSVSVLKFNEGKCSNHGITERLEHVHCFVDCTIQQAIEYCEKNNINPEDCLIYNERTLFGKYCPIFEPLVRPEHKIGPMFGGNYVVSEHDHNFPTYFELDRIVPIPVHDRFETEEEYRTLST